MRLIVIASVVRDAGPVRAEPRIAEDPLQPRNASELLRANANAFEKGASQVPRCDAELARDLLDAKTAVLVPPANRPTREPRAYELSCTGQSIDERPLQ